MFVCVHFLKGFLKAVEEREGEGKEDTTTTLEDLQHQSIETKSAGVKSKRQNLFETEINDPFVRKQLKISESMAMELEHIVHVELCQGGTYFE